MNNKIGREFIESIPKTDLHLHLDGSLRLSTLIELAEQKNIKLPSYDEKELKKIVFKNHYNDLGEYLQGFAYTTAVMQDSASLERIAFELAEDNINEGVKYIEVRFAPQLHQHSKLDIIDVLKAVNKGLLKAKEQYNLTDKVQKGDEPQFEYGIISCAMRMFDYGFSEYFDDLLNVHKHSERKWIFSLASQELVKASIDARDNHRIPIVGFDLAGMERGYPAVDHNPAYAMAHKHFMKKTVHAGEAFGPESIFQAITELHADRIGHGVHLFNEDMIFSSAIEDKKRYVRDLAQYIGDGRTTLEICLTSNLQTLPDIKDIRDHPFKKMREARLSTTICTDNRLVSGTTVTDELKKAVDAFDITAKELKDIVIYGFKRSFFPESYLVKRQYVRSIINYYEKLEKKFNLSR